MFSHMWVKFLLLLSNSVTDNIVVKFCDCCENCNVKRNRTKSKSKHCILVRTKESELKDFLGVNTPLGNEVGLKVVVLGFWTLDLISK